MSYRKKQNTNDNWKDDDQHSKKIIYTETKNPDNVVQEVVVDSNKQNVDRILITENTSAPERKDWNDNVTPQKQKDENFSSNRTDKETNLNITSTDRADTNLNENRSSNWIGSDKQNLDEKLPNQNFVSSENQNVNENFSSNRPYEDTQHLDKDFLSSSTDQNEQYKDDNLTNENFATSNTQNLDKDFSSSRTDQNKQYENDNLTNENFAASNRQNLSENFPSNRSDQYKPDVNDNLTNENFTGSDKQNVNENFSSNRIGQNKQDVDTNLTSDTFAGSEKQSFNENLSRIDQEQNLPEKRDLNENLSEKGDLKKNLPERDLNENSTPINKTDQPSNQHFSQTYSTDKEKQTLDENLSPIHKTDQDKQNLEYKPNQTGNPTDQDYWYYCSHSCNSESRTDNNKDFKQLFDKGKSHTKKMDTLICNSYEMLHEYFDVKYQLPFDLFQSCTGIMFLRLWKGGFFLGGIGGTGIVMAHQNGTWSSPCAVSVGGLQIGFQVGIERVDDILLLHDDAALKLFIENGHFRLGFDASLAVGTFGRDSNMGVVMSKGGESKSIYSYSFAKGAFIGLSLDGGTLSIDNKVNEEFYGRKIGIQEIFYGNASLPQQNDDLMKIVHLLDSFSSHKTAMNESTTTGVNESTTTDVHESTTGVNDSTNLRNDPKPEVPLN